MRIGLEDTTELPNGKPASGGNVEIVKAANAIIDREAAEK